MFPVSSTSSSEFESVTRELDAGERVLWSGQPDPLRLFKRFLPRLLGSLSAVLFWMWPACSLLQAIVKGKMAGMEMVLLLSGLLIPCGIAVWVMTTFLGVIKNARRTHYLLTDQRVLIVFEGKKKTQSVFPSEFFVECRDLAGEKGDVVFKRNGRREIIPEIGFYGIPNARHVERLAREVERQFALT